MDLSLKNTAQSCRGSRRLFPFSKMCLVIFSTLNRRCPSLGIITYLRIIRVGGIHNPLDDLPLKEKGGVYEVSETKSPL